jgi:DNA-binding transcriptional MerR regulator
MHETGTNAGAELTIDELAQRTGMTVRNLRAHQSRGLLPPPQVRGRTGYYGSEHVSRVELIKELQADGFNLEAIRRLLESAGGSTADVLRFTRTARAAFEDEEPEVTTLAELAVQWGNAGSPELLERAMALGLLRSLGDASRSAARGSAGPVPSWRASASPPSARWTSWSPFAGMPTAWRAPTSTCSSTRCGARSTPPAGLPSAGRRFSTRSSACARWRQSRCCRCSSSR